MGVTIHFEGQLFNEAAFRALVETTRTFARENGWPTEPLRSRNAKLLRVRDEVDWNYDGPVKGIRVFPHDDCEPIRLEFDSYLYIQEYTKTQFAGATIHLRVLDLLALIQPFFSTFSVNDEGEYWETRDLTVLVEHMNRTQEVIEDILREDPSAAMKVKTPEGRIIDLIRS
ncbi:MAG: hypothetical protein ACXV78_07195 [Candidatus Angelobacter sp.]